MNVLHIYPMLQAPDAAADCPDPGSRSSFPGIEVQHRRDGGLKSFYCIARNETLFVDLLQNNLHYDS